MEPVAVAALAAVMVVLEYPLAAMVTAAHTVAALAVHIM
jgi:hypothetical protein